MRFLCDMGISLKIAEWLRRQGHDCVHLCEENLERLPNGKIFSKAISEKRVIVTVDLDFGEITALARQQVASVIVFRLRNMRADHVIERMAIALERTTDSLLDGAVVIVEEGRVRIRRLPIIEPE